MACRGYAYLATTYTIHPGGPREAWSMALRVQSVFADRGEIVYSPIVLAAPMEFDFGVEKSHGEWLQWDSPLMRGARELIVLTTPDWQRSKGIAAEVAFFEASGKPVRYVKPAELGIGLVEIGYGNCAGS